MDLRYITCSDPREDTSIPDVLTFLRQNPRAELAVQAHPSRMSAGMPRRQWFETLLSTAATTRVAPNLAVHVNMEWCDMFCQGELTPDLKDWLTRTHQNDTPLVRRIQINLSGSHSPTFHPIAISRIINEFPDHEFIFQYTYPQGMRMRRLANTGARFSVLYDASGGTGRTPRVTGRPFAYALSTGYSGGISPDNVAARLEKIAPKAGNQPIWIDAEGGLKSPTTHHFALNQAQAYVQNAMTWLRSNSK